MIGEYHMSTVSFWSGCVLAAVFLWFLWDQLGAVEKTWRKHNPEDE